MNKIARLIERVIFYSVKAMIIPLDLLAPRVYMRIYLILLKRLGLNIKGTPRYISSYARFDDFKFITVGDRVVISMHVNFLTHDYSITTALIANGMPPATDAAVRQPITVGNNVFIGINALIMPGTTIGDNVIIGGGSVVRGDIPSDSIVIGNPATRIGGLTDKPDRWLQRLKGDGVSFDAF